MKRFTLRALFILLTLSGNCAAATIVVDPAGGGDFTEIQPAIDSAQDGDTVLVKAGDYVITEPIAFKGKAITVKGESGAAETTIRMSETPADPDRASVVVFESGEDAGSVLEGFLFSGGTGEMTTLPWGFGHIGGAVLCLNASNPVVSRCTLSGNSAWRGAGVYCAEGSSPTLTHCTISGNSAPHDAGGVYCGEGSSPTLTNCMISGNSAGWSGGVYCSEGSSPTLTNCTLSGNSALYGAGGVYCGEGSSPTLTNCTISGNSAWRYGGGGVYCAERCSSPTLTSCILWDNVGGSLEVVGPLDAAVSYSCVEAEAIWPGTGNTNADPLFCGWGEKAEVWLDPTNPGPGDGTQGSPFSNTRDATAGYSLALSTGSPCLGTGKDGANMGADTGTCGGLGGSARIVHMSPGTYAAWDLELAHNVSLVGAGAESTVMEGTMYDLRTGALLSDFTVTKGGIMVSAGESPTVTNCTISGNRGGGVICGENSSPILTSCSISGNSAEYGGGVVCWEGSSPTLTNCTISGNSVEYGGGGMACSGGSSPTLTNCTISGNSAGEGGGVVCWEGSSPTLTNCTIAGNYGGGVHCNGSSPTLTSCILWDNVGGSLAVVGASDAAVSYSCVEAEAIWPGTGNTNADPLFVRLGSWEECDPASGPDCIPYEWDGDGNPTAWHRWVFDYHLRAGSPCIDAGTSEGAPTFDIEGNGRPCGAGVDMGAYESGECTSPTIFRRGDPNADSKQNITDAVFVLRYLFAGAATPSCLKAADSDDSGDLDLTDAVYLLGYLFLGGPAPKGPFPDCGPDPTIDGLTCDSFPPCEDLWHE